MSAELDYEAMDDRTLARRFAARDPDAVRVITGRNNQRLFRVAWSILKDRAEAEDAVQSGYLRAFAAIDGFKGEAALSTWLTRIVINEALGKLRSLRRRRTLIDGSSVVAIEEYRDKLMRGSTQSSPDQAIARAELRRVLERAIGDLPDAFRTVFVLREIEHLGVEEVAEALGIPPATVKTRCLRARRRLQKALAPEIENVLAGTFAFAGADCEAMTQRVLAALSPP